jgi:hypothetical protein
MQLIRKGLVYTTKQAYFQDKAYRDKTREYVDLINKILPFIKTKLQFGNEVKIIVCFTKAARNWGYYTPFYKEVRVEVRQSKMRFIDSLIHELVHAQQDFLGKLRTQGQIFYWNDELFGKKPTSHTKYMALPWEVEARKIAAEMTKEVMAMIREENKG